MSDAVFTGTYSDFKIIKTRKVAQMVVEFPLEQGEKFINSFGLPNLPKPSSPTADPPILVPNGVFPDFVILSNFLSIFSCKNFFGLRRKFKFATLASLDGSFIPVPSILATTF